MRAECRNMPPAKGLRLQDSMNMLLWPVLLVLSVRFWVAVICWI